VSIVRNLASTRSLNLRSDSSTGKAQKMPLMSGREPWHSALTMCFRLRCLPRQPPNAYRRHLKGQLKLILGLLSSMTAKLGSSSFIISMRCTAYTYGVCLRLLLRLWYCLQMLVSLMHRRVIRTQFQIYQRIIWQVKQKRRQLSSKFEIF
jgi:hypothetical protein